MAYEIPGTEPCRECGGPTVRRESRRWCPSCEPDPASARLDALEKRVRWLEEIIGKDVG